MSLDSLSYGAISYLSLFDEEKFERTNHDNKDNNEEEDDVSSVSPSELSELLRTSSDDEDFDDDDDDTFTIVSDLTDFSLESTDDITSELSLSVDDFDVNVEGIEASNNRTSSLVDDIMNMLIREAVSGFGQCA